MLAFKIKNGRLSNNVLYVCHSLEINWQKNTVSKLLLNQCEVFGINVFSKLDEPSANGETASCGVVQW
uniref:Uncharacterized protein n=1 Tax=Anguilla anguilla TaxID=7936 RepID=A0A0E9RE67_ANGAN